jgi:hypothetical protein
MALASPEGVWRTPVAVNAVGEALYIIGLRSFGVPRQEREWQLEKNLIVGLGASLNLDGGSAKFPGGDSSPAVSQLHLAALELVIGSEEMRGVRLPDEIFNIQKNPVLDHTTLSSLKSQADRIERYLQRSAGQARPDEFQLLADIILGYMYKKVVRRVTGLSALVSMLIQDARDHPRPWRWMTRMHDSVLRKLGIGHLLQRTLPALVILNDCARLGEWRCANRYRTGLKNAVLEELKRTQCSNGSWIFSSINTMLCLMSLHAGGVELEAPSVQLGLEFLRSQIFQDNEQSRLSTFDNSLWSTCHGLGAYLAIDGRSSMDSDAKRSLLGLLRCQHEHGGFAWGCDAKEESESDSTAFALRVIQRARQTAIGSLAVSIDEAISRGVDYLAALQNRNGVFGLWSRTNVGLVQRPQPLWKQMLLDRISPDHMARIAETLSVVGCERCRRMLGPAIRQILDAQLESGKWFSRWWGSYPVGTGQVIRALSSAVNCTLQNHGLEMPASSFNSMQDGIFAGTRYLIQCQKSDGGWAASVSSNDGLPCPADCSSQPVSSFVVSSLLHCGLPKTSKSIQLGIQYLVSQVVDGRRWECHDSIFTLHSGSLYYPYPFVAHVLGLEAITDYLRD